MFIVTKEIDSENIRKLCRTCLREDGEKMVCLFVGPAGSSLAAKLRTLSCLEVWQGDGLPEKLCDRCVTRAESALLYREQCRAADRALRQAATKVSREALDARVSSSKLYHRQKQEFASLDSGEKSTKCIECGTLFASYQELCTHRQAHLGFVQETRPVQHMNIVECQNISGYVGTDGRLEKTRREMSNGFIVTGGTIESVSSTKNDRAACALHCSLCNHTFTNRVQLINHHGLTHRRDNVETSSSCDDNSVINEKINNLGNSGFEPTINQSIHQTGNVSYDPSTVEAINYSAHINLDSRIIVNDSQIHQRQDASEESEISSDACSDEILRFPSFADVEIQSENLEQRQASHCLTNCEIYKNSLDTETCESNEKKIHRCSVCDKSFNQRSKLLAHNMRHTGEKPYECLDCDKAYTSKSKLNAHTKLHTQIDVHRCNICDKVFSYPSYLAEHVKVHEAKKRNSQTRAAKEYECSMCNKQFRLLKTFKIHLRLHTGKGLLTCEICHKSFGQKYNLKVHLRTHNVASKFFKCHYCGKNFTARGNFVEHLRIHTKVKPFKCGMCSKSFSQSSHLKTHETMHNSLRPHQCVLCGKRYKLAAHLRRHASIHTATKHYKCDLCEQMFSHEFSLKRHLKRHNEAHS